MEENRDFEAEVEQLMEAAPELAGKELPEAVIDAAAAGKSLKAAYDEFKAGEETVLRQNEAARAKAPVGGVSGSGGIVEREVDDFLRGLNEEY
ncbi:MAG: hypothetical protein PUB32_04610 [Clostridiales bacterium]|nr:hypothetical protein [Clostridiales bacterium]